MQYAVHSIDQRLHTLGVDLLAEDPLDELLELRSSDLRGISTTTLLRGMDRLPQPQKSIQK
jgi:hypothetical protein